MAKILSAAIVAVALLVVVNSLTCNQCKYGLAGFCLSNSEVTCSTNTSVCFTGKATFPSVSSSVGFNTQGCREPADCNATTNGTILGVTYETKLDCCSTDNCNPVTVSGAPATKVTLAGISGAALLACVWGSMM
ncbi:hypothetical protein fugu_018748 [Takifugu bimaculatus]|uniref:UPAR/Ly6 domain-containing protein n=1 Tax=Takifugu bimaculatus TaxID=433685 RepID=A0A4Z2BP67_9TELE|nr:hypothetical protein fugu_018748 [Takifugu bimaculatus]